MKKIVASLFVLILLLTTACSTPSDTTDGTTVSVTNSTLGESSSQTSYTQTTENHTSTVSHESTTSVVTSTNTAASGITTTTSTLSTTSTVQTATTSTSSQIPTQSTGSDLYDENGIHYSIKTDNGLWVTSIGTCTQKAITIPGKVGDKAVVGVYASAFMANTDIESITLGEGITDIGQAAFANCSNLKAVTFSSTLRRIEHTAFSGCAIEDLTFPNGLEYIGNNAFKGCSITELTVPDHVTLGTGVFKECQQLKTVIIKDGVTAIPSQTFMNCSALSTITLPGSIENYGTNTFYGCARLTIKQLTLRNSPRTNIFSGMKIENAEIFSDIPDNAFTSAQIGTLTLHEGVAQIGQEAFKEAVITQLALPSSLSEVGVSAFDSCNITDIVFENAVSLGQSAFRNSSVNSITLPVGSQIGLYAFAGCTDLKTIRYGGTLKQWKDTIQAPRYGYIASDYLEINRSTIVCSDGTISAQTTAEPARIRLATYNVGDFTGKNMAAGAKETNAAYQQVIAQIDADIWAFQEDVQFVDEAAGITPYTAIYNALPHHECRGTGTYNYKSFASKAEIIEADYILYEKLSAGHKMFMWATVRIGDKEICLINVHLDWADNNVRREQIRQVIAYSKQYEYCIILGDFNPNDYLNGKQQSDRNLMEEEIKYFTNAGFLTANMGEFGAVPTYVHKGGSVIDNILVTDNMRIEAVGNLKTDWMNDHIPFWADIVI